MKRATLVLLISIAALRGQVPTIPNGSPLNNIPSYTNPGLTYLDTRKPDVNTMYYDPWWLGSVSWYKLLYAPTAFPPVPHGASHGINGSDPVTTNTNQVFGTGSLSFAALPTCNTSVEGTLREIFDASTNLWGTTSTGTGGGHALLWCDSGSWKVIGGDGALTLTTTGTSGPATLTGSVLNIPQYTGGGGGGGGAFLNVISFSATPSFPVTASSSVQVFSITLTGNVTSSTLNVASASNGQQVTFFIKQDGTGSRTFSSPSNVANPCVISPSANVTTTMTGWYDGTNVSGVVCSTNDTFHGVSIAPVHFSLYPTCSALFSGQYGSVDDSTTSVLGAIVTGTGSTTTQTGIRCDGTNWRVSDGLTATPTNTSTTVNGQSCALGSTCTVPAVTSVSCGTGMSGGTITTTGTCNVATALPSTTSVNGTSIPSAVTLTQTIASGTSALGTSAISSGACATVVSTTATGVASTDAIIWAPNASIKAVTGYSPSTGGGLSIAGYASSGFVNWDVCNWTSGSVTPGAVTLNWRVVR